MYTKTCFASGTDYDFGAKDRGYRLITHTSDTLRSLLLTLGVPSAEKVGVLRGDEKVVEKRFDSKKLSARGKKRWSNALDFFGVLYGRNLAKKIELVENVQK